MKYILSSKKSEPGIWYGRYLVYLETIRTSLSSRIYKFASSEKYFCLDSPHSLHDTHIKSLEIRESAESKVEIILRLVGQYHDRDIILEYPEVIEYKIRGRRGKFRYADVFTHEIQLSEKGNLVHEIYCDSGSTLYVECKNFTHREELYMSSNRKRARGVVVARDLRARVARSALSTQS